MKALDNITEKFWDTMIKYRNIIFFTAILFIGSVIRICGMDLITGDYWFYNTWFYDLKENTWFALGHGVGDYSIFFQTVFLALTLIPGKGMYIYKTMSCLFDLGQALLIAGFVCDFKKKEVFGEKFNLSFTLAYLLPTVQFEL